MDELGRDRVRQGGDIEDGQFTSSKTVAGHQVQASARRRLQPVMSPPRPARQHRGGLDHRIYPPRV